MESRAQCHTQPITAHLAKLLLLLGRAILGVVGLLLVLLVVHMQGLPLAAGIAKLVGAERAWSGREALGILAVQALVHHTRLAIVGASFGALADQLLAQPLLVQPSKVAAARAHLLLPQLVAVMEKAAAEFRPTQVVDAHARLARRILDVEWPQLAKFGTPKVKALKLGFAGLEHGVVHVFDARLE
eukprot:4982215-Prymnesium_polylepis.1